MLRNYLTLTLPQFPHLLRGNVKSFMISNNLYNLCNEISTFPVPQNKLNRCLPLFFFPNPSQTNCQIDESYRRML